MKNMTFWLAVWAYHVISGVFTMFSIKYIVLHIDIVCLY